MCLTIPYKIISNNKGHIIIANSQNKKEVKSPFIKIKKGDFVLSQNNIIISKLAKKEALELSKLLSIKL